MRGITYDEMIPGGWQLGAPARRHGPQPHRLVAVLPVVARFCGQHLSEGHDKDLGLVCIEAYNDWMVDEWCADATGA